LLISVRLSGGDDPPPAIAPRVGDENSAAINLSDCAYPVFSVFQTEIRPLVHKTVPNQLGFFARPIYIQCPFKRFSLFVRQNLSDFMDQAETSPNAFE
jgi:hypothetical protein